MMSHVSIGAKRGGQKTLQVHGHEHFVEIGKKGGESVRSREWFHALARKSKKGDVKNV